MYKIQIELRGPLAQHVEASNTCGHCTIEIPCGSTIRDLVRRLKIPENHVGLLLVNNQKSSINYQICNGDQIIIFPVVAGG